MKSDRKNGDGAQEQVKPIAPEFYLVKLLKDEAVQIKADNAVVTTSGAVVFSHGDRAVVGLAPGRWVQFTWMKVNQAEAKGEPEAESRA